MSQNAPAGFDRDAYFAFTKNFPFFQLMGIEVLDVEPLWSKTRVKWRAELNQPAGVMHGGVIASLVDTGIAQAIVCTEEFQNIRAEGGGIVSVDLRIKYLRPVTEGAIICESKIPRMGRRIIHATSVVTNDEGKEVALGDSIYMAVRPENLKPREAES